MPEHTAGHRLGAPQRSDCMACATVAAPPLGQFQASISTDAHASSLSRHALASTSRGTCRWEGPSAWRARGRSCMEQNQTLKT